MTEYTPNVAKWKLPIFNLRARLLRKITGKTNYFHLRHGYDLEDRKRHDLWFVTHYHNSHEEDRNADIIERLRFGWYWRKYSPEVRTVINAIQSNAYNEVPKDIRDYVEKWQPLTSVPPFIVEFIHGMDGQRFREYSDE